MIGNLAQYEISLKYSCKAHTKENLSVVAAGGFILVSLLPLPFPSILF